MDYSANAISRRFELLESQWMEFQKRSTTPDLDEEPLEFPPSLATLDHHEHASASASAEGHTKDTTKAPPVRSNKLTSGVSFASRKSQEPPDSPLSSSSTLSSSSSSSSSYSDILRSDSLKSRRKRLFSEPQTPIKEAIVDTPPASKLRSPLQKPKKSQLSDNPLYATPAHQSRSPPPGSISEEIESRKNALSSRSLFSARNTRRKQPEEVSGEEVDADATSGTMVLQKLRDSLMEVLTELEVKEKCIREVCIERKDAPDFSQGLKECSELESLTNIQEMGGFSELASVVRQSSPGKWCEMVSKICQRMNSYLQKETLLQKWAIAVEKEVMRVLKLEEDIVEAKVLTAQELEMAKKKMKIAEERDSAVAEERNSLAKDKESLYQWVEHLRERQKAVHDREQEVAISMEELKSSAVRLEEEQEGLHKSKLELQEREKEVEEQLSSARTVQEDLHSRQEAVEKDKSRLKQKERELQQAESDLGRKVLATENLSKKLVARERFLNELQAKLEQERHVLEVENELAKKNGLELLAQAAEERKKAKRFEESLKSKEKELNDQENCLKDLEAQLLREQERSHAMHSKLVNDQESVIAEEQALKKKEMLLESKSAEARKEMERLNRERKQVFAECKRLTEMESRIGEAEREFERQRQEHEQMVRKQAEEHEIQLQDIESTRRDLDSRAAELQRRFQYLQNEKRNHENCRRETKDDLERLMKEREEMYAQEEKLNLLKLEIEKAGAEMKTFVTVMDKASTKLDAQRQQVDTSQLQLKALADRLVNKHTHLLEKEKEVALKEEMALSTQSDLRRRMEEVFRKERKLKSGKDTALFELETKLENERENMRMRIADDEERISQLEKALASAEKALFEERMKDRDALYEKERLEEQANNLMSKKKEMSKLEAALKRKEEITEEQGTTLMKLERELKERMQRIENLEKKSYELEKAWNGLREEQEDLEKQKGYLGSVRTHMEQLAANQKAELLELNREREEMRKIKENFANGQREFEKVKQALQFKETKAVQRETTLAEMERKLAKSRQQVEKDADDLKQQLAKAHTELEARKRYVEDRQNAVDAAVQSLKEVATKVNARKRDVEEREQLVQMLEERQRVLISGYNGDVNEVDRGAALNSLGHSKEIKTLKAQQMELERTKQAVQDAKSTLTVQLKASKKMVADASLIAQHTSSEREALEEERRLLEKKRQEMDHALLEREMQVAAEEQRLGSMKKESSQSPRSPAEKQFGLQAEKHLGLQAEKQFGLQAEQSFQFEELRCSFGRWPKPEEVCETEQDTRLEDTYSLMLNDPSANFTNFLNYSQELPRLPSQKRLENVMNSLVEARQASRSRLRRTENALLDLPPTSASTQEIKEALRNLSARLNEMDQIEEGLAGQLKEAYEAEFPELEGSLVDKVELLCKMEEQQNLRAEWEEDMQKQLERINRLQVSSSDCFDNMLSMESVERALSPMLQQQKESTSRDLESNRRVLASPDWSMTFDRLYQQNPAPPLLEEEEEPQQNRRPARRKLLGTQFGCC